jgi:hypothetical protein
MNVDEALNILEIPDSHFSSLTSESLKKIYHKMALKNHPDKCHQDTVFDATHRFQQIQSAYACLSEFLEESCIESKGKEETGEQTKSSFDYIGILNSFIKTVLKEPLGNHPLFASIIKEIVTGCKRVHHDLFASVDKETALNIYAFLTKHQTTLGIDQRIIDLVQESLLKTYAQTHIVVLTPTFKEMYNSDIYKLVRNGETYYVPLWHSELQYESDLNPGYEVIVKCVPSFVQEDIEIDEHNNVHVAIDIPLSTIDIKKGEIPFLIDGVPFSMDCDKLRIVATQIYIIKEKGVPVIDERDMYNDSNRSDIIVTVRLNTSTLY